MKRFIALLSAFLLTLVCAVAEPSDGGDTEILSFDSNPGTGYAWTGFVLGGDSVELDSAEGTYIPNEQADILVGSGGKTQYVLTAVKPGCSIVTFDYSRGWETTVLEQNVILATVDQNLNLSVKDVTDTGVIEGTVLSLNEEDHTALIENGKLGEIVARFDEGMSLPVPGEQITVYTEGTMTLSLPAMMNVLAWRSVPTADARDSADTAQG